MPGKSLRFGCLGAAVFAANALAQVDHGSPFPTRVRTRSFDVSYRVNESALPLDSVRLWYTLDKGVTWEPFGFDEDRQSPITFHAPAEGLMGFYFVLTNGAGASSADPATGTEPHHWVMVDFTPPVVQLHPLRSTAVLGERVVQVRWTAIDTQLGRRPIRLAYRVAAGTDWRPASQEPLANTGRFDWRVPREVGGSVALRLSVTDLGENSVESAEQQIDVSQPSTPAVDPPLDAGGVSGSPSWMDDTMLPGSRRARQRVEQLVSDAERLRADGDYVQGIARLREAVRLDPRLTDAFLLMASMLRRVGDHDRALNAYDIALKQRPATREALLGSALVLRDQNNYSGAAERLRTILRYDPKDAETWMNLGDVAIFQGDELLARECYTRATQIDPQARKVITEAAQRLALMGKTSHEYRASND